MNYAFMKQLSRTCLHPHKVTKLHTRKGESSREAGQQNSERQRDSVEWINPISPKFSEKSSMSACRQWLYFSAVLSYD